MTGLRLGDEGAAVAEVRSRLVQLGLLDDAIDTDPSVFDADLDRAVRAFQQERGITVDGIVGQSTFRRLDDARWQLGDRVLSYVPGHLVSGDDVAELQRRLTTLGFATGRVDGLFGGQTDTALREFQKGVGVTADGTCGPDTFRAFDRLGRAVSGGNATSLREHQTVSELQTGVADKVVVVDPGLTVSPEISHAVAVRLEGRRAALGTQVVLTRGARADRGDDSENALLANDIGAHLVLSVTVDRVHSPNPNGLATFYFGDPRGGTHSPSGLLLAERVHEEVLGRTDLLDCRVHPRTWDLLRMTRMPAVRVVLGYASNPADASRLTSTAFQDAVAEALAAAVTGFCQPRTS